MDSPDNTPQEIDKSISEEKIQNPSNDLNEDSSVTIIK